MTVATMPVVPGKQSDETKAEYESRVIEAFSAIPMSDRIEAKDLLAGDAIFTLRSVKTGTRFTYRIQRFDFTDRVTGEPNGKFGYSVKLLTGPQNTKDYTRMGMLNTGAMELYQTASSRVTPVAQSWQALQFFLTNGIVKRQNYSKVIEVFLAGRCMRCSRVLTDPTSIQQMYGPKCIEKVGM